MALDFGSIAKGYAADEAAKIAKDAGINRAIIDLGGNVVTLGTRRNRTAWRVGIQSPDEGRGAVIVLVQKTNPAATVVTSGVYERK
jgi:thiamine biosynthesis lipoprotein